MSDYNNHNAAAVASGAGDVQNMQTMIASFGQQMNGAVRDAATHLTGDPRATVARSTNRSTNARFLI